MGIQLVFVVETDEKSRSDYIYIKSILDYRYKIQLENRIKISPVFMRGKENYNQRRVANKIDSLCKQYRRNGETKVIFCFDTDQFDINPIDQKMLIEKEIYCRKNNYEYVWFCHDIEEVFLGYSVADNEKTKYASKYATHNDVNKVVINNLKSDIKVRKKSNLVLVLDRILDRYIIPKSPSGM